MKKSIIILLVASLVMIHPLLAQDKNNKEEVLTNIFIEVLTLNHVAPSVIVTKIENSKCKFDVGASALIKLSEDNVSADVISAMIIAERYSKIRREDEEDKKPKKEPKKDSLTR